MEKNYFTEEIERAYRVLGDRAFVKNLMNIDSWFYGKLISEDERKQLYCMNKDMYRAAL